MGEQRATPASDTGGFKSPETFPCQACVDTGEPANDCQLDSDASQSVTALAVSLDTDDGRGPNDHRASFLGQHLHASLPAAQQRNPHRSERLIDDSSGRNSHEDHVTQNRVTNLLR